MNKSFENLNVNALYDVLAEILSEKHGAKITYTVREAEHGRKKNVRQNHN